MAKHLEKELEKLKKRILALGALVEERVRMALRSIESRDEQLAEKIIKKDYEIDEIEVEVEEECLKILALPARCRGSSISDCGDKNRQ